MHRAHFTFDHYEKICKQAICYLVKPEYLTDNSKYFSSFTQISTSLLGCWQ